MKLAMITIVAGLTLAPQAFGAYTAAKLLDVTKMAVEDFEAANPDHAVHFTGYKAWKTGNDAKVKIYVDHSGMAMEFNYLCHEHDGESECHAQ